VFETRETSLSLFFYPNSVSKSRQNLRSLSLRVFPKAPSLRALRLLESKRKKRQRQKGRVTNSRWCDEKERVKVYIWVREDARKTSRFSLLVIIRQVDLFVSSFECATCAFCGKKRRKLGVHYYLLNCAKNYTQRLSSLSRPELGETVGGAGKHDVCAFCGKKRRKLSLTI